VTAGSLRIGRPGTSRAIRAGEGAIVAALLAAGVATAVAVATRVAEPSVLGTVALSLGLALGAYLLASRRYGFTLALVALYLGLLDGYIKLRTGAEATSLTRDVLLAAICLGALVRLIGDRRPIQLPPLSMWVVAFAAAVLVQVLNPNTVSVAKGLAGLRQHLEFVPFFFFGYALLRTKAAFRNLALLIGVIAAINGAVGLVQLQMTPDELAGWGPGYEEKISGTGDVSGRAFVDDDGELRTRPFGLGSDMGFGGSVAVLALPMMLALLATGAPRHRSLLVALLGAGTIIAIATSQSRSCVLEALVVVVAFSALAMAGGRSARALGALVVVAALGFLVVPTISSNTDEGTWDRYDSIAPDRVLDTTYDYRADDFSRISSYVTEFPLGAGLGTVGAASAFGGGERPLETRGVDFNGETQFNFLAIELGVPGLALFLALQALILGLALTRVRRIRDAELRIYIAGVIAPCFAMALGGFGGPSTVALPNAPWFWLALGVAAYWLTRTGASSTTPAAPNRALARAR
jgi:hypothetical protein